MNLQSIKATLGEYAKDTRLNLGSVLSEEGAPDLTLTQIHAIALASAYATKNSALVHAVNLEATLDEPYRHAARAAASIMAMNNVYYRFVHLVGDDYGKMPAKLRMNVIGAPGIDKKDFELMSLAVSAINGCGMCMEAHVHEVVKAGLSKTAVQSTIRITAVINAAAQGLFIGEVDGAGVAQAA